MGTTRNKYDGLAVSERYEPVARAGTPAPSGDLTFAATASTAERWFAQSET